MRNPFNNAGRFFVLGFDGGTGESGPPKALERLSRKFSLGGVILFDRNVESFDQVRRLTGELNALSDSWPLLIGVDQEGGRFQRLKPPHFTSFPRACDVSPASARGVGSRMGRELADLGITIDFAPVLDVNTNPKNPIIGERSFGPDPARVAEAGRAFVRGMQENGVLACGKHFPGHGDTSHDSHLTLPVVTHGPERLKKVELAPFADLFRHGLKTVMTAHVLYPALDIENPATFSPKILTGLLRREMGFDGLAVTDDLGMAGSLGHADLPLACVEAFAAGCDLLLVCDHHERHEEIIENFGRAVGRSEALKKRALESLRRIQNVAGGGACKRSTGSSWGVTASSSLF